MIAERRLDWIDNAKGLGIILVVLGHTIVPQIRAESYSAYFLWTLIYNFHMPLFFFLSGYLFEYEIKKYTDKKRFILSKARKLLLPYLFFSALAYLLIAFALSIDRLAVILESGGYSSAGFVEAVWEILTYQGHADKHLWFVYSLFIVFLVNILLPKLMKHPAMLIVLFPLYISTVFVHYYGILYYTASDLFFFSLARVFLSNEKLREIYKKFNSTALFIIFIAINFSYSAFSVCGPGDSRAAAVLFLTCREITAVLGIAAVCRLAAVLGNKGKAAKALSILGGYSYDIYLMHAPFLVSGVTAILLYYSPLPGFAICAAAFVLGLALPMLVSKLIVRRIPLLSMIVLGEKGS